MKITKTINTATVVMATVEVKDGKAGARRAVEPSWSERW